MVENGIISSENCVCFFHEVKSAAAMQNILYMGFGTGPLMKMPNIKLFSKASCI